MWDTHAYRSIRAIVVLGVDNNTFPNISQRGEKTAPCVRCLHYVCVHVYPGAGVTDREMGKIHWEYAEKNPQAALGESDTAVVPTAESTGASVHPSRQSPRYLSRWCLGVGIFRHRRI